MGQCCGKMPNEDEVDDIILSTIVFSITHDLSISDSEDPFSDPIATQINSKEWITATGNHIVSWYSKEQNQINFKVVSGPDAGVHKFFNYDTFHQGQTGVENFKRGHEGERRT